MSPRVLVIGYGNPGRMDDGLGPAFADAIGQMRLPGVEVDSDYQLNVEDAADLSAAGAVLFADASTACPAPFLFRAVAPSEEATFSTHSLAPENLVAMANALFKAKTKAYALEIRGYEFDVFGERLSEGALKNLAAALQFMEPVLRQRAFDMAAAAFESRKDDAKTGVRS